MKRRKGGTTTTNKTYLMKEISINEELPPQESRSKFWEKYILEVRKSLNQGSLPKNNKGLNHSMFVLIVSPDEMSKMLSPKPLLYGLTKYPSHTALEIFIGKVTNDTLHMNTITTKGSSGFGVKYINGQKNNVNESIIKEGVIKGLIAGTGYASSKSEDHYEGLVRNSKSFEPYSINLYLDIFH